ncbi:hypothetical protein [Chondromyces apiculatus]|uniref:Uncharacterized protein n=1 Tax=Chondromyces apiculatus DSM 436 TaxID=1192034 RepID=A0A017STD7_9BACT|nr:hypothetical protein [Chondromyces apiculatus]EYF00263.1 Hypothetical protein CAP_0992 [Chondromyces apiculatus DSM 436]
MAIWAKGGAFVIATGWGVARCEGSVESIFRFPTDGLRRDQDPPDLLSFVMLDDDGRRALVQRHGEPPALWTDAEGGGALTPCAPDGILGIAAAPGGPMVALTVDEIQGEVRRIVLCPARLEDNRILLGAPLHFKNARRLEWSSALFREGRGWPEHAARNSDNGDDDDDSGEPPFDPHALNVQGRGQWGPWWSGTVQLFANRFGVAVSSTYSGLVAVLDPRTLAVKLTVRVPVERTQFQVFVLPVPEGALITLVANYRHTEFVFVDASGAVRAHRHQFGDDLSWGSDGPGLAWNEETALVSQALDDEQLHVLTLPALSARRFDKEPGYLIDCGSSDDGSIHLLARTERNYGRPHNWRLERWTRQGHRFASQDLPMPDFRRSSAPPTPPPAPRVEGTPALAVIADATTTWRTGLDEQSTLLVQVSNRGGPVSGLWVEIGGQAITEARVLVEDIALESGPASGFVTRGNIARAELPAVSLEAGFEIPAKLPEGEAPPQQPSLTLVLRVRGKRPGQALLTVRVGPRGGASTAGSGMVGKSFVVEG